MTRVQFFFRKDAEWMADKVCKKTAARGNAFSYFILHHNIFSANSGVARMERHGYPRGISGREGAPQVSRVVMVSVMPLVLSRLVHK